MQEASRTEQLILDLHTITAIRVGKFKLKSGIISPYYIDLRELVSYPYLLKLTADVLWKKMRTLFFDVIVGVPYTGIPIATALAIEYNQSMVFTRKEVKKHGIIRPVEGEYHKGQKAIIIDDVITNGDSKFETIKLLEEVDFMVEDIVVLLDRGQGGPELLKKKGYRCHAIFEMDEIFSVLLKYKRIDKDTIKQSRKFMQETRRQFTGK